MTTSTSKLFIGGLSWSTIDSVLFEEFAKYGALDEAIVVRDKLTGRSRGFGFVRFQDPEDAQKAKDATDGNPIDGRVVRVDFASEKRRPVMNMNPYEGVPFNGNSMPNNGAYMNGYPPQQSFMQPHMQGYGYSQYPPQGYGAGMYGMQMPQMQPYQQMAPRNMGYPPQQPPYQSQTPPAGFAQSQQQSFNGPESA